MFCGPKAEGPQGSRASFQKVCFFPLCVARSKSILYDVWTRFAADYDEALLREEFWEHPIIFLKSVPNKMGNAYWAALAAEKTTQGRGRGTLMVLARAEGGGVWQGAQGRHGGRGGGGGGVGEQDQTEELLPTRFGGEWYGGEGRERRRTTGAKEGSIDSLAGKRRTRMRRAGKK